MERPKDRPRLGRGLSSLISVSRPPAEEAAAAGLTPASAGGQVSEAGGQPPATAALVHVAEIAVDQVRPNPHQPRRSFNETALKELADSLKTTGLIQPIIVRRVTDGYELIAGERRLRAAKLAGLAVVPALVREAIDAITQAQMALVENIQREDLNPIDRAEAYQTLIRNLGLTQTELADRLGQERTSVANYLRLLDLTEPVRQLVRDGRLPVGHAKVLAGVVDPAEQQRLAQLAVDQDLTVRNLERLVAAPHVEKAPPPKPSAHLVDLEKSLARALGMRVQVRLTRGSKSRGRVVIHYADLDQFDQLLSRLGVRLDE